MCGIVGLVRKENDGSFFNMRPVARQTLRKMNHRGHNTAGVVIEDEKGNIVWVKGIGEVVEAIPRDWAYCEEARTRNDIAAIGHVRYPTTGSAAPKDGSSVLIRDCSDDQTCSQNASPSLKNAQPFYQHSITLGDCAISHNGNSKNALVIKQELIERGVKFKGESDSEVILMLIIYLVDRKGNDTITAIRQSMRLLQGSYSCLFLTSQGIYAFRDLHANRPLEIAETDDFFIFASEECAWHEMEAKYLRSVAPGEIIEAKVGTCELLSHLPKEEEKPANLATCVLCPIYLKAIYTRYMARIRFGYGKRLFERRPLPGLVIGIPDSGKGTAIGYHFLQSIAFPGRAFRCPCLVKDPDFRRSFLEDTQEARKDKNQHKYFYLFREYKEVIERLAQTEEIIYIILTDDSLIRGNVSKTIIARIRQELEKHFPELYATGRFKIVLLISSPPYKYPCNLGVNTFAQDELLAWIYRNEADPVEAIRQYIGVDILEYLPLEDTKEITASHLGLTANDLCEACFSGDYPVDQIVTPELIASIL